MWTRSSTGSKEGTRREADGLRAPRIQELRPRAAIVKKRRPTSSSGCRSAIRCSTSPCGWRRSRWRRLLHRAQALPQRRLLHRAHLQGDGVPDADVHRFVRARAAARLDRPMAGDDRRSDHQDRPSSAGVRRRHRPGLPTDEGARLTGLQPGKSVAFGRSCLYRARCGDPDR